MPIGSIMITDGGAHPPELWGMETAKRIFDITQVAPERAILGMKTQLKIAEILCEHHGHIQTKERNQLSADAQGRHAMAEHEHVNEAMAEAEHIYSDILAALEGTPWFEKYHDERTMEAAKRTIASDLMTNKAIERAYNKGAQ